MNVQNKTARLIVGPACNFADVGVIMQPHWPAGYVGPLLPLQQLPPAQHKNVAKLSERYARLLQNHVFGLKFGDDERAPMRFLAPKEVVPVAFDPKDLEAIAVETNEDTLRAAMTAPIPRVAEAARARLAELAQVGPPKRGELVGPVPAPAGVPPLPEPPTVETKPGLTAPLGGQDRLPPPPPPRS